MTERIVTLPDWLPEAYAAKYRTHALTFGDRRAEQHFRTIVEAAEKERAKLDAEAQRIAALPRDKRRRVLAAQDVAKGGEAAEDMGYFYSAFAFTSFPYSRVPNGALEYQRDYENGSILIQAGKARFPKPDGSVDWVQQEVPYGPKARLIAAYISSRAVQTQTPRVEVGRSMSEFMQNVGFNVTGGKNGTIRLFMAQVANLMAARVNIGWHSGQRIRQKNVLMFDEMDLHYSADPRQQVLWPNEITLTPSYYAALTQHALPFNWNEMKALSGSARQLDIYLWIKYRANGIKKATPLSWEKLYDQFGGGITRMIDFKRNFAKDLHAVQDVLPYINISEDKNGTVWLAPMPTKTIRSS